jgi:hypothetical protein
MLTGMGYFVFLCVALVWLHLPSEIVLALTMGGVALVVLMLNPLIGVHAFVMLIYFETILTTESGLTGMKVAGPIILAGWLLSYAIRRQAPFRFDTFTVAMLAFLGWLSLSFFYAIDSSESLSRSFTFVQLVVATLMFSSVVDSVPKIRGIYWSIVIWTSLAAVAGLSMYYVQLTRTVQGFRGDRNAFAIYVNLALVCTYVLYQVSRGHARMLLVGVFPLLLFGQALTFSRTGFLAMICAVLLLWYRTARERRVGMLIASIGVVVAVAMFLPTSFWDRVNTILPSVEEKQETVGTRVNLWDIAFQMIEDHPLTGVGIGNFATATVRYAHGKLLVKRLAVHNAYLSIAAETGLVGLFLFLLLHWLAWRSIRSAMRAATLANGPPLKLMAIAAEACLLAMMLAGLSVTSEGMKYLWFYFGLAASLGRIASQVSVTAARGEAIAPVAPSPGPAGERIHAPV